jgi:protein SCO1/2
VAAPLAAQGSYDREAALAISQGVLGSTLRDQTFRDTAGQSFALESLRGKPLVISLIYTSCHHVCPIITASIERNAEIAHEALGEDAFSIVTIGFDWQVDTPDRMRMYASAKNIDVAGWHFLSGDEASVAAISEDLGFQFFDAPAFVEPLKELVFDTPREAGFVDHWVDSFKLFCTVYDPNTGRYAFDYSIFTMIVVGVLCLGAILTFIVTEWRHAR